jgi:hypothetical protein
VALQSIIARMSETRNRFREPIDVFFSDLTMSPFKTSKKNYCAMGIISLKLIRGKIEGSREWPKGHKWFV